ncbi:MAG: tRNA glutamyl-Q(34) synthetase GluQRS [Phycisphaerae bacterium]|nr:tRNA glutamyl-Q(34) synthetase GluQRS [Phycisphaerae bacterium]
MVPRTRLAPSPTGALHLGNARSFLVNWLLAMQGGWNVVLRIEDLDGPRVKAGADRSTIDDLTWLGLDWDDGPVYQSERFHQYQAAIDRLIRAGQAYPCVCSRREIGLAASAPHIGESTSIYPGTCRGRFASIGEARIKSGREPAIRFRVPDEIVRFEDRFAGTQSYDATTDLGDFIIAKGDGTPAYQLAVVVDDHEMGINRIVRGDDLLDSTAKQLLLMDALYSEFEPPKYFHLPLIVGSDGLRLAKRHGDSRLSYYRGRGVSVTRVLRLLARWCGIPDFMPACAKELVDRFDLAHVPRHSIAFTREDERELFESD